MKNNEVIIKEVVFAKANIQKGKIQMNPDGLPEFSFVRTATCVIDNEENKAIDIETGEVFDVVKREKGIILNDEYPRILDGQEHALRLMPKDWDKISLLYQLAIKDRAKKIYKRYLASKQEDNIVKVKKIGKKPQNKKSN